MDETELTVMDRLKEKLKTSLTFAFPKREGRSFIDNDAGGKQMGGVLEQEQNDQTLWPIGDLSWTLNAAEQQYETAIENDWQWYGQYCYWGLTLTAVDLSSGQSIKDSN